MCVGHEWRVQAERPRQHLLDEVDAGLQVHAEVDELPLNALLLVLLLLQHEHVVVEELLQLLVGEVDAQLLEAVELQGGDREVWVRWAGVCGPRGRPRAVSSLAMGVAGLSLVRVGREHPLKTRGHLYPWGAHGIPQGLASGGCLCEPVSSHSPGPTHVEYLEAGDVQDAYEVLAWLLGLQGGVDPRHHPVEHPLIYGLGQRPSGIRHLEGREETHMRECWEELIAKLPWLHWASTSAI